ncbi:MAG TPA: AAA family ATPase, partial [Bacillales bacterium]|nr:AAA family ATPase [Bacillales bacterium]
NGRLVRNVVEEARRKQSRRLMNDGGMDTLTSEELRLLIPKDFGYTEQEQFDLEKELSKIVGNEKVKDFIRQLAAQIKVQKLRKQQGIKSPSGQTLHIIFSGDPGTGKTTIARILGHMLKDLGVLKSGHLIETDRSGLVAGYTGQTAEKTNDIISQALGGILFIDEAYALASGGPGDFGKEAIDTLVKGMEDHRDNLLVILAGYEEDMEQFLQTNAGLRSRFPNKFNFENYSLVEMLKIAQIIIKNKGLKVSKGGFQTLKNELLPAVGNREAGNGRFVRNLIEKADRNQNLRISKMENPSKEELITLISDDFKGGV